MPLALRDALQRVRVTTDPTEIAALKKHAWGIKRRWVLDMKTHAFKRRADRGGVFAKPKKLHTITSLALPYLDGQDGFEWSKNAVLW